MKRRRTPLSFLVLVPGLEQGIDDQFAPGPADADAISPCHGKTQCDQSSPQVFREGGIRSAVHALQRSPLFVRKVVPGHR